MDAAYLDARMSDASVAALEAKRDPLRWLGRVLRGDLGESSAYGRPVVELIGERLPQTALLVAGGLAGGWAAALAALLVGLAARSRAVDAALAAAGGASLAQPAALLALLCVYLDLPGSLAIAVLLFPQVYAYLRNVADHILEEPHVLAAFARGVPRRTVLWRHVLLRAAPAAVSLLGVSVSIAVGAAVPVEAIADLPGVGQLIWEGALARDLPLVVTLTAIVAFVAIASNFAADAAAGRWGIEAP